MDHVCFSSPPEARGARREKAASSEAPPRLQPGDRRILLGSPGVSRLFSSQAHNLKWRWSPAGLQLSRELRGWGQHRPAIRQNPKAQATSSTDDCIRNTSIHPDPQAKWRSGPSPCHCHLSPGFVQPSLRLFQVCAERISSLMLWVPGGRPVR